jgi:ribosome biogenesis GTPase A
MQLLDTPGILMPKIEDRETGLKLAFCGSIKDEILDVSELCLEFIKFIMKVYPQALPGRYGLAGAGEHRGTEHRGTVLLCRRDDTCVKGANKTSCPSMSGDDTKEPSPCVPCVPLSGDDTKEPSLCVPLCVPKEPSLCVEGSCVESPVAFAPGHMSTEGYGAASTEDACVPGNISTESALAMMESIAVSRGFLMRGNRIDYERTARTVLDEFRGGRLGRISLERPV